MPSFSRKTILAATDTIARFKSRAEIDRFRLEHGLESIPSEGSLKDRANSIARYLLENPERKSDDGRNLVDTIIEALVERAISECTKHEYGIFNHRRFESMYGELVRALERDGFSVEDGWLRRALPESLDLPKADDEVHTLLDSFGFETPKGHLDQAITAHARRDWAAANSQFRPFIEGLLDEMAQKLAGIASTLPPPGRQRRQWLAQLNPPFLIPQLNEWMGDGKGFVEAFFRRLHPQGSHPGLSDEDDSTFRLHLVLLVARLLLRRLRDRIHP